MKASHVGSLERKQGNVRRTISLCWVHVHVVPSVLGVLRTRAGVKRTTTAITVTAFHRRTVKRIDPPGDALFVKGAHAEATGGELFARPIVVLIVVVVVVDRVDGTCSSFSNYHSSPKAVQNIGSILLFFVYQR